MTLTIFFIYFACGLLFGVGLFISQMTNPDKVIAFLDLAGNWDPSLAFVMAGALAVAIPGFLWVKKQKHPLLANQFHISVKTSIDKHLIVGAAIFGIGWGMSGYCPGPAFTNLGLGNVEAMVMVFAIYLGFYCEHLLFSGRD